MRTRFAALREWRIGDTFNRLPLCDTPNTHKFPENNEVISAPGPQFPRRSGYKHLLVAFILLFQFGQSACSKPPRYPILPVYHSGETKRFKTGINLFAAMRSAQDNYRRKKETWRLAIERTLANGSTLRGSFKATLSVERPHALHLSIYTSMRIKLLEVLVVGKKRTIKFRNKKPELAQDLMKLLDTLLDDIQAINRFDPQPKIDRRKIEETISLRAQSDPTFSLKEYSGDRLRRQWSAYAASLAITRLEDHHRDDDIRTIIFGDFEKHQGVIVPQKIVVTHEGALTQWTSIEVIRTRVDGPANPLLKKK